MAYVTRVLITGARAPVALHLARLFHAAGHSVLLSDTHRFPISRGTRIAGYERLPPPRGNVATYGEAVERLVRDEGIELVIPTCEEVFFLAAARDLHRATIPLFAPPLKTLAQAHHKGAFARLATGLGADPPRTDVIESAAELRAVGDLRERVLKPAWSRFASRVLVRPDVDALPQVLPTAADPWVVQDYLPGEEICSFGVARGGRLLAFSAYRPLHRAGVGAGIAFEPVKDATAERFAAGFAERTGWTGQLSFDFRRDGEQRLHVIECNPRAVSGLHFFAARDGLPGVYLGGGAAEASDRRAMTLPLALLAYGLPQAMRERAVGAWWTDFRRVGNIMAFPGDRSLLGGQLLALGEIALLALRTGKTLQQAATHDIEWNGEALG